ncbi:DNA repair-scaffolding protein-like [Stylophora pistillata]|uniref:DNA repair-scaffolding protein-like n=1 Tax=Stylophora pistillata TaxID=50429 RepID=UPI000C050610|nr:DNA repair-scaffolding protein-like [Stylophora pistillata]
MVMMSWNNFEEFKRFTRSGANVRKKRPASSVGWQNSSTRKRRQTSSDSIYYSSKPESVNEIEGFSTDEEDDVLLDSDSASTLCLWRNISKPSIKRKYSDWRSLSEKRVSALDGQRLSHTDPVPKSGDGGDNRGSDFIPDGAHDLLMHCSNTPTEDEIVWCASDEEELPCNVFGDTGGDSNAKCLLSETKQGDVIKSRILSRVQPTRIIPASTSAKDENIISDFETDQGSSQESLSADITVLTPTPVSPVVVGTPKTASEWLKQVQQNSPQKSEVEMSPEGRGVGLNYDSAKKKRKFFRSGLAQHLQHIISRENSEKAFWNHRVTETEQSRKTKPSQMDSCLVVQIISDQPQGLIHLTQCLLCSKEISLRQKFLFVLFTCETWRQFALHTGAMVKIYPPWQRLDITGCPWPVLLCTYFCEQHSAPPDQLPAKSLQSPKGGLCVPLNHEFNSSHLHQSPKENFTPSKLLFDDIDGENTKQNTKAVTVSTLLTAQPAQPAQPVRSRSSRGSKPDTSILNAIESSGGCSGVLATFQCLVQRVYCKKTQLTKETERTQSFFLLNEQLRSQAKSVKEIAYEELSWFLLVQDVHGMFAEVQVPARFQDSNDWKSCIANGENQVFVFLNVKVRKRTNRIRSPGLFGVIQSLLCSNDDNNTAKQVDKSKQTVTQENKIEETLSNCAPDFCYVLAVQESSRTMLCQETDDCGDSRKTLGSLYKPDPVRTLNDFLQVQDTVNDPQRVSALCMLLYCRSTGSSTAGNNDYSCPFELFVTDASLKYGTKSLESSDGFLPYVKITGKSSHVLPSELRAVPTNCGMNLSAKHLLLKAQESHELFADSYSVIRKVVPHSTAGANGSLYVESIPEEILESLDTLKPLCLPDLTVHSCLGFIYRMEGLSFVLICDHKIFNSYPGCRLGHFLAALLQLYQSTIDKLLLKSCQDSDQGYDIDTVLGKRLGPLNCYVTDLSKQQHGSLAKTSFTVEEIRIQ